MRANANFLVNSYNLSNKTIFKLTWNIQKIIMLICSVQMRPFMIGFVAHAQLEKLYTYD